MDTITQVQIAMQTVLTEATEQAEQALGYTKRPDVAKFTASTIVQTLVLGWLAHPEATIEQLAQTAARVGVTVSPQAIDQRFTHATGDLLYAVLQAAVAQIVAADPVAIPVLQRFTGVRVMDSTTIVLPEALEEYHRGCGGGGAVTTNTSAALKCGVQFDLLTGAIAGVNVADGRAADAGLPMQHESVPRGTLRLADLGFMDLTVFADIDANDGFWLSKLDPRTIITTEEYPKGLPLLDFVRSLGAGATWDGAVRLGRDHRLSARLLVQRVPQEVADQRRRRIRRDAKSKGAKASPLTLALADWTILGTNVPSNRLTLAEALVVMRVRWQIELLLKLWKSHGKIDEWRTDNPARIRCEVYAKLLAMLIQHWALLASCWQYPDRSLVKAAQVVRDSAHELARAKGDPTRLREALETLQVILQRTARMNTRRKEPNTYQLLIALTTGHSEQIFA